MKRICILNGGCGLHEGIFRQILESVKENYQITKFPHKADVLIQYLCAFTDMELGQTFEKLAYLSQVKKEGATLIVCGCAVNAIEKAFFEAIPFVDYFFEYKDFAEKITELLEAKLSEDYYMGDCPGRLVLNITDGCSKPGGWCSFCKMHYMGIKAKSNGSIKYYVNLVKRNKVPVVVVTGLNTCHYGTDFGDKKPKLHLLLKELTKIPTLKWIEVDNIPSASAYDELLDEIEHNKKIYFVEFFVQSGSDKMLQLMNIGSNVSRIESILEYFRNKALMSGVIVSHPGETMEDVDETIEFIKRNNLWNLKVFHCFSSHKTPASEMEELPREEAEAHFDKVWNAVNELRHKYLDGLIGKELYGFVSDLEINQNNNSRNNRIISMTSLDFDGSFEGAQEKFSLKYGDKVKVIVTKVIDYDKPCLNVKILEVCDE